MPLVHWYRRCTSTDFSEHGRVWLRARERERVGQKERGSERVTANALVLTFQNTAEFGSNRDPTTVDKKMAVMHAVVQAPVQAIF
jgi:hypothetical protein